ncbi:flagellar hook capping FlgD N-terminal domain-containing protein [Bradyrhizobium sp. LHD-71]|uniref:flagellar hook assembly protein FlgD n=1 Tax=Bradyrhizobium sp. LHD-71 TaxID=3072141 RepID=UPI00280D5937|nr:flagellar hook capping FlgD N-terminal domain-containing protein [Bradyrhizobium sp. LHD-71]MDQ8728142.1 flagellar hook capping FlgD N-terminal domain-containing protein [Bradyrhizobium sp. LHD-71]
MAVNAGSPTIPVSAPSQKQPSTSTGTSSTNGATLASNFQTFLTLLTTQLQNQNPLDPLDTNQFTQQLVQFAQVEQQLKQNDQLASLIELQKTTQATQALNFVGSTVVVDGTTSALDNGLATWSLTAPRDVSATVNVINSVGQTVYSGTFSINAGKHDFVWDGRGNDGVQWPAGDYKLSIVAKDAAGQTTIVQTDSQGVVDSVDLTANPPLLSIGTQTFTVDQIKRIVKGSSV